jgi:hypothetical protein
MTDFKIHKPDDELIIELKRKAEDQKKKKNNWIHRGRGDDYLFSDDEEETCNWVRRWNLGYETYRVLLQLPTVPLYYNAMQSSAPVYTTMYFGETEQMFTAYNTSGVPLNGRYTAEFNRDSGMVTVSGSASFAFQADNRGNSWGITNGNYNGIRYDVLFLRRVGGFPSEPVGSISWMMNPVYSNRSAQLIVSRAGNVFSIAGIDMVQHLTQNIDHLTGTVPLPDPDTEPCTPEAATAFATAVKDSVHAQLQTYLQLRSIAWGEMQTN